MAEASKSKGDVGELVDLVVSYAKQETVGPLRGLGRFAVFGLVGSTLLAVGVSVLLLGGLRALQNETGTTFSGDRSWLPYLATAAGAVLVAGLAGWRVTRGPARRRSRP
ncbi:MAG TPA: hypothetical protein VK428_05055 [Acidimicrobiales bacterium]|nr:hypothetical protein [Acidimicrobiales bacterium]